MLDFLCKYTSNSPEYEKDLILEEDNLVFKRLEPGISLDEGRLIIGKKIFDDLDFDHAHTEKHML